ncbi:MAG: GAF domain-containing protein [Chloroflexota bacterium]
MRVLKSVSIPAAPRLYSRRLARVFLFPWIQPVYTTALAAFSLYLGTPPQWVILWWTFTAVCFILLDFTSSQSRLMAIVYWFLKKVGLKPRQRPDLAETLQVFSLYPDPLLLSRRHYLRWLLALTVLLTTWGFAIYQSLVLLESDATQMLLAVFFLTFGVLPYNILIADPLGNAGRGRKYALWIAVAVAGVMAGSLAFRRLTADTYVTLSSVVVIIVLYTSIFISQRLWTGEHTLNEVLWGISLDLLARLRGSAKLPSVAAIIKLRLQHDRIFILEATPDRQWLRITDQAGLTSDALGQVIPIHRSLTGRAFQEKATVVWNDVSACPYYYSLSDNDGIQAEIAVPILYQGSVYGILDVQSQRAGIYGPGDVNALETIARILGAAIAAGRNDLHFSQAVQLWECLAAATTTNPLASEQEVFDLFAEFAQETLGADLVIYFPLSLAGCPVAAPYTRGKFRQPQFLKPPGNDTTSSLLKLIAGWKPYYEANVTAESLVARSASADDAPVFVTREEIRSTCFVPVGIGQERLGALFLNFRQPREFDAMFRFTVLGLAQSLAKVTAQVRYREILFQSFGRPELGVHNIAGRHGLKEGALTKTAGLQLESSVDCCHSLKECPLSPLLCTVEEFLEEIRLAESSIPPDFWRENLEGQLRGYASTLPNKSDGRRRQLQLDIAPEVERESAWVKLALYRVITEAANNAVFHGDATHIRVNLQREAAAIRLTVVNDGVSLPGTAHFKQSNHGIFTLLQEFRDKMGAEATIEGNKSGIGTIISVSVPALPQLNGDDEEEE